MTGAEPGRAVAGEVSRETYEAALGLAWLSRFGCNSSLRLLRRHGAETIWRASVEILLEMGMPAIAVPRFLKKRDEFRIESALRAVQESGLTFIPFGDTLFPKELAGLRYPPAGLFAKGDLSVLSRLLEMPRVTIVGTRRGTSYGHRVTERLAMAFVEEGVAVISGLALGIDGRAHQATLDAGGTTLAVLGCGADVVYPPRHRRLYGRVIDEGMVVSEYPPGTPPARWTFPHRNRLLAALGDAVIVTEGSRISGALQTAAAALELGHPVFAVPGQITTDGHQGCNWLIYDGAAPVVDASVTVEEFLLRTRMERVDRRSVSEKQAAMTGSAVESPDAASPSLDESLLRVLEAAPCSVDSLTLRTGGTARDVAAALGRLEIRGEVARSDGGLYIRAP